MGPEWSEQDRLHAVALGWDEFFDQHWSTLDRPDCSPARVITHHRDRYRLHGTRFETDAVISGRLRQSQAPAVGDWVAVLRGIPDDLSRIEAVLPRRTGFTRKVAGDELRQQVLAANVDWVWIVSDLGNETNLQPVAGQATYRRNPSLPGFGSVGSRFNNCRGQPKVDCEP